MAVVVVVAVAVEPRTVLVASLGSAVVFEFVNDGVRLCDGRVIDEADEMEMRSVMKVMETAVE